MKGTDLLIVSDEVYEHIIFDGVQHESMARHPELAARSFVVGSFGKTYHTTGWKIGYAVAPAELTAEFRKVHQFVTFSTITPVQYALADFLSSRRGLRELAPFFQRKRDLFLELMHGSRFRPLKSRGSYFQLMDYSAITDGARRRFRHPADQGTRRRIDPDVAVPVIARPLRRCCGSVSRRKTRRSSARPSGCGRYDPARITGAHRMTLRYRVWRSLLVLLVGTLAAVLHGQATRLAPDTFKELAFRSIGPGLTSGRISDVAIDPKNPSVWYVAASVGGLWKTENRGNTFTPVFDTYGLVLARRGHRRSATTPTSSGSAPERTTTSAA